MSRFPLCLEETLKWEGNWSNDPYDSGGATMKGVIQRVYDAWRTRNGLPRQTVRKISNSELEAIYRENYWAEVKGDQLPAGLDLAVFDFGVNSGPSRSIKKLQGVLGVAADGQIGPITLEAVNQCDVEGTIKALQNSRRRFVRQIRVYWRFGKGWERRINGVEIAALAMVGKDVRELPPMPVPKPEPDAQSATQGRADEEKQPVSAAPVATTVAAGSAAIAAAANTPVIPAPPTEAVTLLSGWQTFAQTVQGLGTFATNHWGWVITALGLYGMIVYGLPWAYRRLSP